MVVVVVVEDTEALSVARWKGKVLMERAGEDGERKEAGESPGREACDKGTYIVMILLVAHDLVHNLRGLDTL